MISIIEAFFSGCISKIINDGKDYSWPKIKSVIKDRHDQNISTKICRVIEKSLNIVTDNAYKNSDKLYDAIEKIFNNFKNHNDTLESVKCGLNVLGTDASDQRCENFLEKFYEGIRSDDDLYKAIMMDLELKDIKISQKINEKLDKNHVELIEKLDSIRESSIEEKIDAEELKFQNNKKQDYINLWNSRLFLHLDNNKKPLTLADAFIMPDYTIYQYPQKINFSDKDTLEDMIKKFVIYERTSTMLITGVPGMGKTSIVSWIAQKYEANDNFMILRFRDWDSEDLGNGLLKAICNTLKCKRKDLNEKLLVLDGFDEIKSLDRRKQILNKFLNDIKDLEKSKIIITSRPTYIDSINFQIRVELLPFNVKKIQRFYKKITGIALNKNDIDKNNLDVMGIPVILYMAIMSKIDITKSSTKPELYNRIFAEKGGIFDRFSEYDSGSQLLRNADNVKKYLEFLQKTAFMMFEKDNLLLSKNECEIPKLEFEGRDVSILEFPIKHLFENTKTNIEFIHKSVYEYFISEYIFYAISEIIEKDDFKIEDLAGVMGRLFKYRKLSFEIIEFLKYRVSNSLNDKYDIVSNTFNLMIEDGMTYYTGECYRNVIDCELRVFYNMLEIIHLWERDYYDFEEKINYYIKTCQNMFGVNLIRLTLRGAELSRIDLRGAYLSEAKLAGTRLRGTILSKLNLRGVDLSKADLRRANLSRTDLREANLIESNLSKADLRGTDLRGANLNKANLRGAYLNKATFDEKQVSNLKRIFNLKGIRVYIEKTQETISYEEYCKTKH